MDIDVDPYETRYVERMREFVRNHFNGPKMNAIYDAHGDVLADVALMETSQLTSAVEELWNHAAEREAKVNDLSFSGLGRS